MPGRTAAPGSLLVLVPVLVLVLAWVVVLLVLLG